MHAKKKQFISSSMAMKLAINFPIFDPNPNLLPSSTRLRFSRQNTAANGYTQEPSPNANQTSRSTGEPTVSHPALKFSNIPKPNLRPVTKSPPQNVNISEDGLSYVIEGAPFQFKYSYTETPKAKPLQMREPPFLPFAPTTMPRPWTGRAPLPPSKKNKKQFDSFVLPPPHKKGVKPVQSPGPYLPGTSPRYVRSREEILGEPLTKEEITELVRSCVKTSRQLNMGRDGFTHNMLDNIHAHWKRRRVCKIKCKGVCTVDMDNVCQQLEEKTGGKIIYRRGGTLYLFRGRNYNYKTQPCFPLMLWKPVPPVYPRLIQRVPEGLTLEEATEMRQKGRTLTPICKLGKNGVYFNLANNVREAFEECELVRINCQGLNKSDYRKIGAKLRDLVPCTLLSFDNEHLLMWRGRNWKSALPDLGDDCKKENKTDIDNENSKTMPSEALDILAPCLQNNPAEHAINLSHDIGISSSSSDVTVDNIEVPCPTKISKQSMSVIGEASLTTAYEAETTYVASDSCDEPESCWSASPSMITSHYDSNVKFPLKAMSDSHGTADILDSKSFGDGFSASISGSNAMPGSSDSYTYGMVDPHSDELLDDSGGADVNPPSRSSSPCMKEISLLLEQAVEDGSALVLDNDSLDADNIYQTTVFFAKSAPPGPVFMKHRKVVVQKSGKQLKQEGSVLETRKSDKQPKQEVSQISTSVAVSTKGKRGKSSRSLRKENFEERLLNVVPQGTLGVDELAKLLT